MTNQRHTLWKIEDPATIDRIAAVVAPEPVFIADGHHRYETAVAYAREKDALGTDQPEAFLLNTLSSLSDPGLSVLPTHRLVKGVAPDVLNLIFRKLDPYFDLLMVDAADLESRLRLTVENQPVFGLVLPSGEINQMTVRDASALASVLPADLAPSLRSLEVVLLQYLALDKALGIPAAEVAKTDRIAYTRDADDLAFLLPVSSASVPANLTWAFCSGVHRLRRSGTFPWRARLCRKNRVRSSMPRPNCSPAF